MEAAGPSQRPCASPKIFDVFINHRGPDVKESLASQLYNSLEEKGCRAFLDSQELEKGDFFPSAIKDAINSAAVHIAIFSKRYAESFWCLEELRLMLKTKAKLIPVFYDVAPEELRRIEKGKYGLAFEKYKEKGRYLDKLEDWKKALHLVSSISGYDLTKDNQQNSEKELKKIVSKVLEEVEKTRPIDVAKNPVGLNELVENFERRCQMVSEQKVGMIGIFGSGGVGKTTLAKELFNRKRLQYHGSCFLFDVREASSKGELPYLQSKLLEDLLKEKRRFQSTDEGASYLRHRLEKSQSMRFLLVVDDIDQPKQLESLLDIESLPCGSLVMVTTRDERVLIRTGITLRYIMPRMDLNNSRELFCLHAFHQRRPATGYEDLVENFVKVCEGLPLSLQVLGGHVHGSCDKDYWQLELDKVRKMLPEDIICRLKISFDALDSEQKQIFMDIACFFVGKPKNMAMIIWEGSGWSGEHALQTLIDKCLVHEVKSWDLLLRMHDNLRDLGRQMAVELGTPCRIWRPRDLQFLALKGFKNILTEANGHSFRCLNSTFDKDTGTHITYFLGNSNNSAQTSTILLWFEVKRGHSKRIPSWIPLQNLRSLSILEEPSGIPYSLWQHMYRRCLRTLISHETQLWKSIAQGLSQLKELQLHGMHLREFPTSLGMLTHLDKLDITRWCKETIEGKMLSDTLKKLINLRTLTLRHLKVSGKVTFGKSGEASPMTRIETIHIEGLKLLTNVSIVGDHCPSLKSLHITNMSKLSEMDLTGVTTLDSLMLVCCRKLKRAAGNFDLKNLVSLSIVGCQQFEELSGYIALSCPVSPMTRIETLDIDGLKLLTKVLISGEHCPSLKTLHITNMSNLSEMELIGVTTLNFLMLGSCIKLKRIARNFDLKNLESLRIVECQQFEELPSLATLSCLRNITLDGCQKLQNITEIEKLKELKSLYLSTGDRAAWNCIQMFQRMPSEFTTVIGRAGNAAESTINANLFSDMIGVDAVSDIHVNENGEIEATLNSPESLSDIIVCAVVQSPGRNILDSYSHEFFP
ncbi:hypothetical protein SUGI_0755570 [Cryptomeria japonica]|uniref:disease resistance protein Roq1 n=1 Tax=Cryptomeria japonica TaxID=3369 RepID=UPI0024147912|nr:disease resistance protein Roq1 [Cryptomeria japonica]GLJ37252.1 hypothetical protein SUGI_0755570 [Cryptomeria japonica]